MAYEYKQGFFKPKHPEKYKGDANNIVYRSGWEKRVMDWCDTNKNVVSWSSEEVIIPYISPIDNRPHRYFVDFYVQAKDNNGNLQTYLLEVKPKAQTIEPKPQSRKTKKY
ncbi:head completion protein, partial [bacterium]|nr:head completion protein [bacterium]